MSLQTFARLMLPRCRDNEAGQVRAIQARTYAKESKEGGEKPAKVESIEQIKMPGFVSPETKNEEGYFTQIAKSQIEELKKKMDKPKPENPEKDHI